MIKYRFINMIIFISNRFLRDLMLTYYFHNGNANVSLLYIDEMEKIGLKPWFITTQMSPENKH